MLLATKGHWIIACDVVKETPKTYHVAYRDEPNKVRKLPKAVEGINYLLTNDGAAIDQWFKDSVTVFKPKENA